jgi:hypothetical protein
MVRHQHPYGGTCSIIGEFTPTELIEWLKKSGWRKYVPALLSAQGCGQAMKVLDIIMDRREVLVYSTTADYFRVEVINR